MGRREFRVLWLYFVELGKTKQEKKDMIADHNPDLGFAAYDSIHEIKINIQANILSKIS